MLVFEQASGAEDGYLGVRLGLKPALILKPYAALKRRSSTVLRARYYGHGTSRTVLLARYYAHGTTHARGFFRKLFSVRCQALVGAW